VLATILARKQLEPVPLTTLGLTNNFTSTASSPEILAPTTPLIPFLILYLFNFVEPFADFDVNALYLLIMLESH